MLLLMNWTWPLPNTKLLPECRLPTMQMNAKTYLKIHTTGKHSKPKVSATA